MATRFITRALSTAALGIVLTLSFAATTATSPAWGSTAGAIQLDPPAAPSHCRTGQFRIRDRRKGDYISYNVSWRDNSTNEDGFTVEWWWRNQAGEWVLSGSQNLAANSTQFPLGGRPGPDYRFRVKAFNASGDSAWSNWAN